MKKVILVVIMAFIYHLQAASQAPTPAKGSYEFYKHKQKVNRSTATILLTGGTLLTFSGFMVDLGNMFKADKVNDKTGIVLIYSGLTAMAGSVPFFIAAGANKKKALAIKSQPTATLAPGKFRYIPALTLEIRF